MIKEMITILTLSKGRMKAEAEQVFKKKKIKNNPRKRKIIDWFYQRLSKYSYTLYECD